MLVALLAPLLTATLTLPKPPAWAVRCAQLDGLPTPDVLGSPRGDTIVVVTGIVVSRYDSGTRLLEGRSTDTGRMLALALEPQTRFDAGPEPIATGDKAMLRLVLDPPCIARVDDIEVNLWVSDARVLDVLPGGFRFEKLDYHTAEADGRLAPEDGVVVPQIAVPMPYATFNLNESDAGSLAELAPGMRLKIYGRKSPRSKVVHFFRVERF